MHPAREGGARVLVAESMSMTMTIRTRLVSLVSLGAVLVAVGVVGVASPASAIDLHTLAAVGSIDSLTVRYDGTDSRPELHIIGWAGDLNGGGDNGDDRVAGVELWEPGAGGAHTTVSWAEGQNFDYPRPDVKRAYPALGPNQGFDVYGPAPTTGLQTVCLRLYSMSAYPESADRIVCQTIDVPKQRPFIATLTGSGAYGSPLTLHAGTTSGTQRYSWWTMNIGAPNPHMAPVPIAGANAATYTPGPALMGHQIYGVVSTRLPGVTIEQMPDPMPVGSAFATPAERVASDDRYSTSVAASQRAFPDGAAGAPVAYIASGAAFPDALSAGAAAAKEHGTLLLTPPNVLDSRVASELRRLHPARIIVVGGPAALSEGVVAGLKALPITTAIKRISGADRFAVSRAVVADAFGASAPDLYIVTGNAFPDALAAAAAGAAAGRPVLLTNGWSAAPDAATTAALRAWKTTHATIVGGTASVSAGIEHSLERAGIAVQRAAGSDRYETANALARTLAPSHTAYLANGTRFPDALTAAVMETTHPGPLLLTMGSCTPGSTLAVMIDTHVTQRVLVGGESAQRDGVADTGC